MSDEKGQLQDSADAEIEREIRANRKFSLAEALGRSAGDLMKGTSPVTPRRQAALEIEQFLETHLADSGGALTVVLERRVIDSEAMLSSGFERPLVALAQVTGLILASEARLERFVREVDSEWGRFNSERPFFETNGQPPHPDDPYTADSVRRSLSKLIEEL